MSRVKIKQYAEERDLKSSFLSCEKDTETILKKLFVDTRPFDEKLKRLMLINNKDCLDDLTNPAYKEIIENTSLKDMVDKQYIRLQPKLKLGEHEEVKNYIILSFDNFTPTSNDQYRDCIIMIDILSHTDYWDIGNFRQRPLKIAGYIDGILNKSRLSGIGRLEFIGCNELVFDENFSGYCLMYRAVHGVDDILEEEEDE